jgi:hypothetical protein
MNRLFRGNPGRLLIRSIQDGGRGGALRANAVNSFVTSAP